MESSQPSQEPITRRVAVEGSSDAVVLDVRLPDGDVQRRGGPAAGVRWGLTLIMLEPGRWSRFARHH